MTRITCCGIAVCAVHKERDERTVWRGGGGGFDKHITRKRSILPWPRAAAFINANSLFIPPVMSADAGWCRRGDAKWHVKFNPRPPAARFRAHSRRITGRGPRGKREIDFILDLCKVIVEKVCASIKARVSARRPSDDRDETTTQVRGRACVVPPAPRSRDEIP